MERIRDSLLFVGRAPRGTSGKEIAPKWLCELYLLNFSKLLHSSEDSSTTRHCQVGLLLQL